MGKKWLTGVTVATKHPKHVTVEPYVCKARKIER